MKPNEYNERLECRRMVNDFCQRWREEEHHCHECPANGCHICVSENFFFKEKLKQVKSETLALYEYRFIDFEKMQSVHKAVTADHHKTVSIGDDRICAIDKNGKIAELFPSYKSAGIWAGTKQYSIIKWSVANGVTYAGYKWELLTPEQIKERSFI